MSWRYGYGVEYIKEGKSKIREFRFDEAAARAFCQKCTKYGDEWRLFRYRPQTVIDNFLEAKITWFGRTAQVSQILIILALLAANVLLWRLLPL